MASTDLIGDLDSVTGFTNVSQYPSQKSVMRSEYCAISGSRWLLSSLGSFSLTASASGNTVYNCFYTGMDSYGVINQDGYSSTFIYRPALFSGPLAQNATLAYKTAMAQRILNDQWIINQRCTLSV